MQIEVDFEVFKALTALRRSEDDTVNEVLRRKLDLGATETIQPPASQNGDGWHPKGVHFPQGTEFRVSYKGKTYTGGVDQGMMLVGGKRYKSPSAAAVDITKHPVNGWIFWECRLPGQSRWTTMDSVRSRMK